jgi:hypothetical protein
VLGAIMTFGYLVERGSPLFPGHQELVGTPLFAGGLLGAIGMAWLGFRSAAVEQSS